MKQLLTCLLLSVMLLSCKEEVVSRSFKAELIIGNDRSIPFILKHDKLGYTIVNGDERIELIESEKDDSIYLEHPVFNAFLAFRSYGDSLKGYWYNKEKGDYKLPLVAYLGDKLFNSSDSISVLQNKYKVSFSEGDDSYPAIGLFTQDEEKVAGTFLTETGDYRYLNGMVDQNKLLLSTFDMSHAFLFEAVIEGEKLRGVFYSGNHHEENWSAIAQTNAILKDAMHLVDVIDSIPANFSATGLSKENIDIDHPLFKNKAVIIQLFGSWCPNCYDESRFLNSIYNKYKDDLEIMGVAFERTETFEASVDKIEKFRRGLEIKYPLSYGGKASKTIAQEHFPFLSAVKAFPTLLFYNKEHELIAVHSGFNGPGTGEVYLETKNEIIEQIEKIIQE